MKKLIFAGMYTILTLSPICFANTAPELKLTSFSRVTANDNTNVTAEVCGTLSGLSQGPYLIRLTTDYNTNSPSTFYTWVGQANSFCAVVTTYQGVIQAELEMPSVSQLTSIKAQAKF